MEEFLLYFQSPLLPCKSIDIFTAYSQYPPHLFRIWNHFGGGGGGEEGGGASQRGTGHHTDAASLIMEPLGRDRALEVPFGSRFISTHSVIVANSCNVKSQPKTKDIDTYFVREYVHSGASNHDV